MATKIMSILLLAVWMTLFSVASTSLLNDKRIINGKEAEPLTHPYIVSLQESLWGNWYHFCGGVVIDQNWVLTAASCVFYHYRDHIWRVKFGERDLENHDTWEFSRKIQYVKIHENFTHRTYTDDIALIRMDSPVKLEGHVQPATLSQNDSDFVYTKCVLAGWGVQGNVTHVTQSTVLREVNITQIPNDLCVFILNEYIDEEPLPSYRDPDPSFRDALREHFTIRDSNICVFDFTPGPEGQQSVCYYDEGGPMMCGEDNSILAGIFSKEYHCQGPNVYTRVSAYYKWIRDTIDEVDSTAVTGQPTA